MSAAWYAMIAAMAVQAARILALAMMAVLVCQMTRYLYGVMA